MFVIHIKNIALETDLGLALLDSKSYEPVETRIGTTADMDWGF